MHHRRKRGEKVKWKRKGEQIKMAREGEQKGRRRRGGSHRPGSGKKAKTSKIATCRQTRTKVVQLPQTCLSFLFEVPSLTKRAREKERERRE
mmetsp:Transcript_14955/g.30206  ORF Transcript_14955/g.30206 Transcript_14955/m.30206 type:complete len:92 (-) Transcript_14955:2014-2289(-)